MKANLLWWVAVAGVVAVAGIDGGPRAVGGSGLGRLLGAAPAPGPVDCDSVVMEDFCGNVTTNSCPSRARYPLLTDPRPNEEAKVYDTGKPKQGCLIYHHKRCLHPMTSHPGKCS